jgi:Tol biopolymer transport system component
MAPEQVRGDTVDARSDIFSFGALLHEMLTGQRAFAGDSAADVLGAILRDEPPAVSQSNPSLPDAVGRIVHHCLEKNPEERFQSARDLGFALAASSSSSNSAITMAPATTRRRAFPWLLIVAVLGWALAGWFWRQGDTSSEDTGEPVSVLPWTFSGSDRMPAASPDGDQVAFVSTREGQPQIWIKQVNGGGERRLTRGPDLAVRYSPDGSQLLFARRRTRGRDLFRVPVVGGNPRKLVDDAEEGDWAPDGERVAFTRIISPELAPDATQETQTIEIRTLDIRTGNETLLTSIRDLYCYGVRWSPDGRSIMVSEGSVTGNAVNSKALRLIDVDSGESRRIVPRGLSTAFTASEWIDEHRVVVGQHASLLSAIGSPLSRILLVDVRDDSDTNLFWAMTNVPLGGFTFTTLAPIGQGRLVFDSYKTRQNLLRFDVDNMQSPVVLTTGEARDRQPIVSPDGRLVLFSSSRSGNLDLWMRDLQTGELLQVTDDTADDWDPAFTPDGQQILWSSSRSGNLEVWSMNLDGSGARQVTQTNVNAENPTATADGEWIFYASSDPESPGLWGIHPDGTGTKMFFEGNVNVPDTDPSGRWVMFSLNQNKSSFIYVLDVPSGDIFQAAEIDQLEGETPNILIGRGRWWPDSRSFIFVGADAQGRSGVFRQDFVPGENTDATRRAVAGFSPDYAIETLAVTPDGRSMVLSTLVETQVLQMADGITQLP